MFRAKVYRSADSGCTQIPGFFDVSEHDLVILRRIRKQLIMIYFDDKGDFMGVFPRHYGEIAERRRDRITAAFNRKFYDIFRIKIQPICGKRAPSTMLDSL